MSLYEINGQIAQLAEMLAEGEIDQQIYQDTIASLGAESQIEQLVKAIRNAEAEAAMYKEEKDRFAEKQKSAETACERMKKLLIDYMVVTESKSINTGLFKVNIGQTQSVELMYDDINNYSDAYIIEQPPKLDKRKMLSDMKAGITVDGASLKTTNFVKIK